MVMNVLPPASLRGTLCPSSACIYVLAVLFRAIVHRFDADVLVLTYADNWEVLLDHFDRLPPLVDHILRVMDVLCLPVQLSKCWLWSLSPAGRKQLRSLRFRSQGIPVLLSARVLGADVAYSYRRAAKVRNTRVRQCHARFLRIRALPVSRVLRTQLVLRGAFPAALLRLRLCLYLPFGAFGLRQLRRSACLVAGSILGSRLQLEPLRWWIHNGLFC